jgi:hypothetical protein
MRDARLGIGDDPGVRRALDPQRIEIAGAHQARVARELAQQRFQARMLEEDAGEQCVPRRAHRVVIASAATRMTSRYCNKRASGR